MTTELTNLQRTLEAKHNLTPNILAALTRQESGGNMGAVSSAGARGMTQFMPGTRQHMIDTYGLDPWKDEESALKSTALYLGEIRNTVGDDPQKMLAGYNWGPNAVKHAVERYGDDWLAHAPNETKGYVKNIMSHVGTGVNLGYKRKGKKDDEYDYEDNAEIETRRTYLRERGMGDEEVAKLSPGEMLGVRFVLMILTLAIGAAEEAGQQQAGLVVDNTQHTMGTPAPLQQLTSRTAGIGLVPT